GDVAGVGERQVAVGTQLVVEALERAGLDELSTEAVVLLLGSVAPVHRLGCEDRRPVFDPLEQLLVGGARAHRYSAVKDLVRRYGPDRSRVWWCTCTPTGRAELSGGW